MTRDTIISEGTEETLQLGREWGRQAVPGWVVGLSGALGSGKTQLVRGLARGLGIPAPVTSPTFALVHELEGGRLPFRHLDLYRMRDAGDLESAGLAEYLEGRNEGVVAVEWVERWLGNWMEEALPSHAPPRLRLVHLHCLSPRRSRIRYEDPGH